MIIFCTEVRDVPDDAPDDAVVEDEGLIIVELELMVLVRSRTKTPESLCWSKFASTADEDGAVVPKAHIMFCWVSEFACL